MEIWKSIFGYEGLYEVSNYGNVKSLISNGKILKPSKDKAGYLILTLCKDKNHKTKLVHRLVAIAFLHNPENKPEVNHKGDDGNKQNNHVYNLEWSTSLENMRHAIKNNFIKPNFTKIAIEKRKKVMQINPITNDVINTFESAHEASRKTGFNRGNISTACRTKNKIVENYKWAYDD